MTWKPPTHAEWIRLGKRIKSTKIQKSEQTIMKDAITAFEIVGKMVEEGKNRGYTKEDVIQLICAGVIRL